MVSLYCWKIDYERGFDFKILLATKYGLILMMQLSRSFCKMKIIIENMFNFICLNILYMLTIFCVNRKKYALRNIYFTENAIQATCISFMNLIKTKPYYYHLVKTICCYGFFGSIGSHYYYSQL